jgi:hypothetical protein
VSPACDTTGSRVVCRVHASPTAWPLTCGNECPQCTALTCVFPGESVTLKTRNDSSTASTMLTAFIIRTDSTPGSGSTVQAASDDISIQHSGLTDLSAGNADLVPSLTPGSSYNVELVYRRTSGGNMVVTAPWVMVEPVWV